MFSIEVHVSIPFNRQRFIYPIQTVFQLRHIIRYGPNPAEIEENHETPRIG
jgi:hypothetical protein